VSVVHAVTTTLVVLRDAADSVRASAAGQDADVVALARGVDYLVLQLAALGVTCLESHDQPRCGNCGAPVKGERT
jgi:hypothetical protein